MLLNGYIPVPGAATVGGSPIDAFQADAFRQNDALFESLFQAVLSSPLIPNGVDGDVTIPPPTSPVKKYVKVLNAKSITVNNPVELEVKVPLVWFAREKIVVNNTINARGKGAPSGEPGDFGGSGGGGDSAAGHACKMPLSGQEMLPGGAAKAEGKNLSDPQYRDWATRALSVLALCKGGASGGDANNGAGGGVVFLCAPLIEMQSSGKIDARGADAGAGSNAGGGGGGLVVLIARKLIKVNDTAGGNVLFQGGAGKGSGKKGGDGWVMKREFG